MRELLERTRSDVPNPSRPESYRSVMFTMTPQARAIAAFSLALLLVTGNLNRVALVVYSVSGNSLDGATPRVVISLLIVVTGLGVLWLANSAASLTSTTPGGSWDLHVAQAARFLAVVGVLITLLILIASVTDNGLFFYSGLPTG
jgi:hypothetical protein